MPDCLEKYKKIIEEANKNPNYKYVDKNFNVTTP